VGGHLCHVRYRGHESEMCLLTLTKSAFYSQKISFVELPHHLSMCCNRVNTVDRQVSTLLTPSPHITRFHIARNSTSAEFLKTALCGIPLNGIPQNRVMQNSNGISSTVLLTRFSHNAEFQNSKNAR
jgi:hypothetical protein